MVRQGVVLVPESRALFTDMTVEDNLLLGAFSRWRGGARDLPASIEGCLVCFPAWPNAADNAPARCQAASARCLRWAVR